MIDRIYKRADHDPPLSIEKWEWQYHHIGIPTDKAHPGEKYLPALKFYVQGFENSPFGIEWMRFEPASPVHELVKSLPHIAFQVKDLDQELKRMDFRIITLPNSPSEGVRVAMIEHNGVPVELIEFTDLP